MADELRTVARLTFDALTGVVGIVQDMHRAIARGGLGPVGHVQSAIAAPIYGMVRAGLAAGTAVAETALRDSAHVLPDKVTGVLNGAIGDRLAIHYPALATPLRLHVSGERLPTGHLVVFVHGLVHIEQHWWQEGPDYGQLLADGIGATPLYVRYNSGRHVATNGARLAVLLDEVVAGWPVPVRGLSLVGHSMGGLVARSAVHEAVEADLRWLDVLRNVICLGSPHLGSPVERGAAVAALVLNGFAASAPLARVVAGRSAGIKDMARGAPYTAAPQARQRFLAATVAADPTSVRGRIIGDLLVSTASATDRSQTADRDVIGGLTHSALLHHPEVYARLVNWLSSPEYAVHAQAEGAERSPR